MYERDLQDLIRGLRSDAAKQNEARFIAQVVDEIRKEIASSDMTLKGGAVCKLTYLEMLGYDMSWASFHVVEVMSSPHFHIKCGGYLAATQSFNQETDVLMLTTNLLKKDMASGAPADVSAALNCLAHIITPSLAQDLSQDLIPMLNHTRPLIRKRAVVILFKILLLDPEAFDICFQKLRDRLEDNDVGVVSTTVNVLCELSRRDPARYLPLAPQLFGLLTTSSNNWMLIKIVKIFGSLSPWEPRLVKKLQTPITDLINTTPAISLLYECVRTCIIGNLFQGTSGDSLAKACTDKLAVFLDDPDQNLKYIALLALVKIVPSHPHLVLEYQRYILSSIQDADLSIRLRAMDLLSAMVDRDNLQTIVQHLLAQLSPAQEPSLPTASDSLQRVASGQTSSTPLGSVLLPAYRLDVARRIIDMCSREMYSNISDFEWYLSVLVDLAYVAGVDIGEEITAQIIDVVVRVRTVRPFAVRLMEKLLGDVQLLERTREPNERNAGVLWAAAWVCGEFCSNVDHPVNTVHLLLQPHTMNLSAEIRAAYILAASKIIGYWTAGVAARWNPQDVRCVQSAVQQALSDIAPSMSDSDIEVQDRAVTFAKLLEFMQADLSGYDRKAAPLHDTDPSSQPSYPKSLRLIQPLFSAYELNAVASEAQESVRIPPGLDMEFTIIPNEVAFGDPARQPTKNKRRKAQRNHASGGGIQVDSVGEQNTSKDAFPAFNQANHPSRYEDADLDSIPIVRIGDLTIHASQVVDASRVSPVIDKLGEMPHDVEDSVAGVSAAPQESAITSPQAIQVVRSKKKSSKIKKGIAS